MGTIADYMAQTIDKIADAAHSAARRTVLDTLGKWPTTDISFSFDGVIVEPSMFANVKKLIEKGRIQVKFAPTLAGRAIYNSTGNTMYVGMLHTNMLSEKGLIVHEAVHAAFDAKALSNDTSTHKHQYMYVVESEASAYLAQAIYQAKGSHGLTEISTKGAKWAAAKRLAEMVMNGEKLTWEDCQELRKGIVADPDYTDTAYTFVEYKGV